MCITDGGSMGRRVLAASFIGCYAFLFSGFDMLALLIRYGRANVVFNRDLPV